MIKTHCICAFPFFQQHLFTLTVKWGENVEETNKKIPEIKDSTAVSTMTTFCLSES